MASFSPVVNASDWSVADNLSREWATILLFDPDEEVRAAVLSSAWTTTEMLERLLRRYPSERANIIQHDLAPIELMRERPVGCTGTRDRERLARGAGLSESDFRQFMRACTSVAKDDTETTLGMVLESL